MLNTLGEEQVLVYFGFSVSVDYIGRVERWRLFSFLGSLLGMGCSLSVGFVLVYFLI